MELSPKEKFKIINYILKFIDFMIWLGIGSAIALATLVKIGYLNMSYGWAFVPGFILMTILSIMMRICAGAGARRWKDD